MSAEVPDSVRLQQWLKQKAVPALRMHPVPAHPDDLSPLGSHLAGPPFWPAGEPWPVCGECGRPLHFIGQVRLDQDGAPSPGGAELITFHDCWECFPRGPEQATAYHVRLWRNIASIPLEEVPPPVIDDVGFGKWHPVACSLSFRAVRSVPHWEDARRDLTGLDLGSAPWEAYDAACRELTGAPNPESRLGGFPGWIQSAEHPNCPVCGGPMDLVWQLDSEHETGLMWGDTGRVYIFACRRWCSDQALALIMQSC